MEFEQKAEEKKMSMSKNIARLAVTAGLTAALSFGGVMAPVTMAFAEGTPVATTSGNVTINEETYKDTTFKGIQIFKAKVTQDQKSEGVWDSTGDKTLSDIDWANNSVKAAVTTAFDNVDNGSKPSDLPNDNSAQAWVNFINNHSSEVVGNNVNAGSVLDMIAKSLEGQTWTDAKSGTPGTFEGIDAGYWLFETKSVGATTGADRNKDAYTSPIFAVVGGEDVKVEPKKDVPSVTKAVKDDNNGSFVTDGNKGVFEAPNRVADSASDQLIEYQLAGTVASNINTYEKYSYTFTDDLPSTMVPNLSDGKPVVEVKIDNAKVKEGYYTANYVTDQGKNELVVSFDNLKGEIKSDKDKDITVSGSSKIYVNYKAKLNPTKVNADILGKGQKNTVTLTYSNNPHSNETGTTVVHPAYDYTYGIDVTKVGNEETPKKLSGVVFKLQEKNDEGELENMFIDCTGVKQTNAEKAKLTTDSSGKINVVGLDEGTYVLTEVTPAPGYDNSHGDKGITFTITSGELSENDTTVVTPNAKVTDGDNQTLVKVENSTDGMVHLIVTDKKGSNLPLTGLNGVTFTWIAGGAVLCIGVAHLIRSRKQAEESEQE